MERREHYDPEDIEQLLMERGFDELLDEERAYVLRHLSGREEYEAMRSLLMTVHRTEPDHDLLEPEEAVRDRVVAAFREQQRPGWRVWLNSLGAAILPRDASAMWRPALALGAIALLIGAALWVMRPTPVMEVAELNGPKAAKDGGIPAKEDKERPEAPADVPEDKGQGAAPLQVPVTPAPASPVEATDDTDRQDATVAEDLNDDRAGSPDAAAAAVVVSEAEAEVVSGAHAAPKAAADMPLDEKNVAVTNSGYTSNWSLANAQGAVTLEAAKGKEEQERAKRGAAKKELADRSMEDDRLLALLRAAW